MISNLFYFAVLFLSCLLFDDSYASSSATQRTSNKPRSVHAESTNNSTVSRYSNTQIDQNIGRLQPNYFGASIKNIIASASKSPRGEFETTAQYKSRVGNGIDARIYGIMFEDGSKCFVTYDADKQSFAFSIYPDLGVSGNYKIDYDKQALILNKSIAASGEYEASNAFGAKAMVTSTRYKEYGIIPLSWKDRSFKPIVFDIPVPLDRAPALKASIRVLAIVRFSGSIDDLISGRHITEATISEPSEIFVESHYFRGDLLSLWVYDIKTGEIFAKIEQ